MEIDVSKLKYGTISKIAINGSYNIPKLIIKRKDIIEIADVLVDGYLTNNYDLYLNVSTTIKMNDSRTLEPIDLNIDFLIDENIAENEEYLKNNQNKLDIITILWENIVLEIPIRVVSDENEEFKLQGNGWELTDDNKKIDTRLAPLADLLKERKE